MRKYVAFRAFCIKCKRFFALFASFSPSQASIHFINIVENVCQPIYTAHTEINSITQSTMAFAFVSQQKYNKITIQTPMRGNVNQSGVCGKCWIDQRYYSALIFHMTTPSNRTIQQFSCCRHRAHKHAYECIHRFVTQHSIEMECRNYENSRMPFKQMIFFPLVI